MKDYFLKVDPEMAHAYRSEERERLAAVTKLTRELSGLLLGILADGTVNRKEANYVRDWFDAYPLVLRDPVVNALRKRIETIYNDGLVSECELEELKKVFGSFAGEDGSPSELPLDVPPPKIVFPGNTFCFTGTFLCGGRDWCESLTKSKYGLIEEKVTLRLRYLVMGSKVTESWANGAYGRKIATALRLKENNPNAPWIVSEKHWITAVKGEA